MVKILMLRNLNKRYKSKRAVAFAKHLLRHRCTIRDTAKHFGYSKSTVFKDLKERLPEVDLYLTKKVIKQLNVNKELRHIRGGMATKKYWEERRREVQ